jgi:acetyltransferase-like isoleucine patch superfamily enzyme
MAIKAIAILNDGKRRDRLRLRNCDDCGRLSHLHDLPANGDVSGVRYTNCADVVFYTIHGGGRSWPGGGYLPDPILANNATLAGHVTIENNAILGGLSAVHQFCRVGTHAIISGLTGISQDIPPYMMAAGDRAKLYGLNSVGLKRHQFSCRWA